jgi:hypothetical protein
MAIRRRGADHGAMAERGFHRIEDDIAETWVEDWAGAGVAELEAYLAKHADFQRFLAARDATPLPAPE